MRDFNIFQQGLIFLDNTTLEVHPLTDRLHSILKLKEPLVEALLEGPVTVPHIIKRANFRTDFIHNNAFPIAGSVWDQNEEIHGVPNYNRVYDSNYISR